MQSSALIARQASQSGSGLREKNYTTLMELDRMETASSFATLPFSQAFNLWLQTRRPYISERTAKDYGDYAAALCEFLGAIIVQDIGYRTVQAFQLWRSSSQGESEPESYKHAAGSVRIRNEINGVLKPILKEAGVWREIKERRFRHLPVPREGAGTFIPPDAQAELIGIALTTPRLILSGHVIRVMSKTGAGPGELLKVRDRDFDEEGRRIHIVIGAKNDGARMRWLYLTPSAFESMLWVRARWKRLGGKDRNDFLFPHRKLIKKGAAFTRPMKSIDRAWTTIRAEWVRRYPHRAAMAHVRLYDFRVSVAIQLLRTGKLSLATIKKALGWCPSSAMIDRYFKETQEMLREAMSVLEDGHAN